MEKLLDFLKTTTRREKTLLIVFFCVILVFLYLQFLARPLEETIYAKERQDSSQLEGPKKKYTEEDISSVLHKIQANPQVQNYQELDRSFVEEDHLTMEVDFSLKMQKDQLASFIRFLEKNYEVQEKKIEVKGDWTDMEVKIHFPLKFKQISKEDPLPSQVQASPKPVDPEKAKGLALVETKSPSPAMGQNPSQVPTQPQTTGQGKILKTRVQAKVLTSPEKKISKPKAQVKESPLKIQETYKPMDQETKLQTMSLWSQDLLNTEANVQFKSLNLEGPRFLNPILREEEDLAFSYLNERGEEGILRLTFEPVRIENLLLTCQVAGLPDTWVLYIKDGRENAAFLWDKGAWSGQWVYGLDFQVKKQDFVDVIEIKAYQ